MTSFLNYLITALALIVFSTPFTPNPSMGNYQMEIVSDSLVHLKGGFNNAYYMNDSLSSIHYYLEIAADEYVPDNQNRLPLNVSLVIDRSGSMNGDKIEYVKKAVLFVIENLGTDDFLSIVVYDGEVEVLVPPQKVTDKDKLKWKVNDLICGGVTNLSGGMLKGYEQVKTNYKQGYVNRVLLLSDGLANKGITSEEQLKEIAQTKSQNDGIAISSFGVGLEFNEDLMMNLAEYGRGNYHFIESPDNIPTIFKEELDGLLSVVAQNLELKISLPDGMRISQLYGYEHGNNPIEVNLNLHDLISEETKSLAMDLEALDMAEEYEIVVQLSYDDAITGEHKTKNLSSKISLTTDAELLRSSCDSFVTSQAVMFRSNYLLSQTMRAVDNGDMALAQNWMNINKGLLETNVSYVAGNGSLQVQDSIVLMYDSTVFRSDVFLRSTPAEKKYIQKSSKSLNYSTKTKKYKK